MDQKEETRTSWDIKNQKIIKRIQEKIKTSEEISGEITQRRVEE